MPAPDPRCGAGAVMLPDLSIPAPDEALRARVRAAIDAKTKPPGSLGRIERLAEQIAVAQGTEAPSTSARLFICAGDHGLVAEGVSAWPQEVTAAMVQNFVAGGAAANVFARTVGAEVTVVDAGIATPLAGAPGLIRAGIRAGTRNAALEDALTRAEVEAALAFGARLGQEAAGDGTRVIALGEMGIGNTATAALLTQALTGAPLAEIVGPGAGVGPGGIDAKRAILERTVARRPGRLSPAEALAAFGGLEIAVLAGILIGGAAASAVVVVDGFIASAAALAALGARPEAAHACIFAHRSREPGHRAILDALNADPLLDLDMALGEGTAALLALPLLTAAAAMLREMATFDSAGITR